MAAAAIVVLMFALALLLAAAREGIVDGMTRGAPTVKRWGGWVLVVVGAWFVVLAVFADAFADLFPV